MIGKGERGPDAIESIRKHEVGLSDCCGRCSLPGLKSNPVGTDRRL